MAKEKFLTVLVPIRDGDITATVQHVSDLPPAGASNINNIYKVSDDGLYRRSWFNPSSGQSGAYEYRIVNDREFPYIGQPMEIYDFTYDATRMGTAPIISASGVMWFAEKDGSDLDITLDDLWLDYWQECFVIYNGDMFCLKQIPTATKNNEDARYKYDLDFVSERVVMESVYLYDVVSPFITDRPVSENSVFGFFGDVRALSQRINASLIRSGLATLARKYEPYPDMPGTEVPYLSFEQWNTMGVDPLALVTAGVFPNAGAAGLFRNLIYNNLHGDYNAYLHQYVYDTDEDGEFIVSGYQVKIGMDAKGEPVTSEEKLISFENNTIHEALQEFHDTFDLQYYYAKEKGLNGLFTGNTLIWVSDCEYDFADIDPETGDYVRDADGLPTTEHPFDYGVNFEDGNNAALISKEKANTTDKIVTRITGVGGTDNIPWYYPNPSPDGWIKPLYKTKGVVQNVTVDYPADEGDTAEEQKMFEKYIKNRIGNNFTFGMVKFSRIQSEYESIEPEILPDINAVLNLTYLIPLKTYNLLTSEPADWSTAYSNYYELREDGYHALTEPVVFHANTYYEKELLYSTPRLTLDMTLLSSSGCNRMVFQHLRGMVTLEEYDTAEAPYENPSDFQVMCENRDGLDYINVTENDSFKMGVQFYISSLPLAKAWHYEGVRYPAKVVYSVDDPRCQNHFDHTNREYHEYIFHDDAYLGEDFYGESGLVPYVVWDESVIWSGNISVGGVDYKLMEHRIYGAVRAGYSTDGTEETKRNPIYREQDKQYRSIEENGMIFRCQTSTQCNVNTGDNQTAYLGNPRMLKEEWFETFVAMKLKLIDGDSWYLNSREVVLEDYGMSLPDGYTPDIFDTIEFSRLKYITPQPNLMPELYVKTDGERRFYDAHNYYPLQDVPAGGVDEAVGEQVLSVGGTDKVVNPIYMEEESDPVDRHYDFENEYMRKHPHEHIENFDDVRPTIEGQTNYIPVTVSADVIADWANAYTAYYTKDAVSGEFEHATSTYNAKETYYLILRIDVVEDYGYDLTDNDEIWESSEDGSVEGDYKHPYFYAKLRPLGFNLFDLALQDEMVLSLTTGNCGACQFKIGVDENTKKNPVQIWEYDVYDGDNILTANKLFNAGDLRRYVDTSKWYYNIGNVLTPIEKDANIISGGMLVDKPSMYERYVYTAESVESGLVGSMKQDGKLHFEGDVITNGPYIDRQQDTSENYVWVALMKDTDTYGVLMPSARPNYEDPNFNVYIRPKSITDVHTPSSTPEEDDENADKFVFINIKMPQAYLRRAERVLSRKLVEYMYENNYQKFNFNIHFSRIFISQNIKVDENINENSVVYVRSNRAVCRQYVKHYTYRMSHDEPYPEITVDMNEELSVTRTFKQQQALIQRRDSGRLSSQLTALARQIQGAIGKRMVDRNTDTVMTGNVIVHGEGTSIVEMARGGGSGGGTVTQTVQWVYF